MLKIKLSRTGKTSRPSYRIIVAEARSKNDGKVIDTIGNYNPLTNPATINLDKEKYNTWIKSGAQPTPTVKNISKKA